MTLTGIYKAYKRHQRRYWAEQSRRHPPPTSEPRQEPREYTQQDWCQECGEFTGDDPAGHECEELDDKEDEEN